MASYPTQNARPHGRAGTVLSLTSVLLLAACASAPTQPAAVRAAEQAIAAVDQTVRADLSSPELIEAREKLNAARHAAAHGRMGDAERFALESQVNTELASARSEAARARALNEELKRSAQTLMEELQRKPGA